jgi:hypothetical protein
MMPNPEVLPVIAEAFGTDSRMYELMSYVVEPSPWSRPEYLILNFDDFTNRFWWLFDAVLGGPEPGDDE